MPTRKSGRQQPPPSQNVSTNINQPLFLNLKPEEEGGVRGGVRCWQKRKNDAKRNAPFARRTWKPPPPPWNVRPKTGQEGPTTPKQQSSRISKWKKDESSRVRDRENGRVRLVQKKRKETTKKDNEINERTLSPSKTGHKTGTISTAFDPPPQQQSTTWRVVR
jgi:hypothetical protein